MAKRSGMIRGRISGPAVGLDPGPTPGVNAIMAADSLPTLQRTDAAFIGSLTAGNMPRATVSWWQYVNSQSGTSNAFQWRDDTGSGEEALFQYSNNGLRFLASFEIGAFARNVQIACAINFMPIFQWAHIIASYDIDTLTVLMAVNGQLCKSSELQTEVIESLAVPQSAWENPRAFFLQLNAAAYGIWFGHEFIDLTDSDNIAKFINTNYEPVQLGPDGSNPTGVQPLLYLDDPLSNVFRNRGFGGNFDTIDGTLVDSNHGPISPARYGHDNQSTAGLFCLFDDLSVGNTTQFSLSCWIRPQATSGPLITAHDGSTFYMDIGFDTSDRITYTFKNVAGDTVLEGLSTTAGSFSNVWNHLAFSVNMQAATGADAIRIVQNGVDVTATPSTFTASESIGFGAAGAALYNGNDNNTDTDFFWSQWWMDFGTFLDFSDEDVLEVFLTILQNAPRNLGSSGETPTGSAPEVYIDFPTFLGTDPVTYPFLTNRGTGGDFTQIGTHIAATTNPAQSNLP